MWSGRNVPTFRSTLLPLSSGSLEWFVGVFIEKKPQWGIHALCTSVSFAAGMTFTATILIQFAVEVSVCAARNFVTVVSGVCADMWQLVSVRVYCTVYM
jgi:hypothetical protein